MEFAGQLLTSGALSGLIGFLIWNLFNTKLQVRDDKIKNLEETVKELEKENKSYVLKADHHNDKENMDRQLKEIRDDIRDIPNKLTNMLRQFIKT